MVAVSSSRAAKRSALDVLKDFTFKHKYKMVSVGAVIALLILWEVGSVFEWFNPKFIPPISTVWAAFTDVLKNGYNSYSLGAHLWASMSRLLIAIAVAFLIAVPLGLLAGSNGIDLFYHVIFPSCLPQILTGLRTAVGVAYATMVAAEMVAAVSGIGWLVLDASKYVRYDIVYFGIIIMGAIAILIDALIRMIIRRVTPWTQA